MITLKTFLTYCSFNRNIVLFQSWMLYLLTFKTPLKTKMEAIVRPRSWAEAGFRPGSAGEALYSGCGLHHHPVQHRAVSHCGQVGSARDWPCWHHILVTSPLRFRQRCIFLVNLSYRMGCLASSLFPSHPNGGISVAALVVYSSGPIIGSGLCLLLPETSGIPLPDSVEDCDRQPLPVLFACVSSDRWGISITGDTSPSLAFMGLSWTAQAVRRTAQGPGW